MVIYIDISMYFIEYTKHKLIICCDDTSCYINLVINKYVGMYFFFSFYIQKNICIMVLNK